MKKINKTLTIALTALLTSSLALAETEVTGKLSYETSAFSKSGSIIGDRGNARTVGTGSSPTPTTTGYRGVTTEATPSHSSGDLFKSEAKAQIFFDGDVKDSTFHVEIQGVFDGKVVDSYDSVEAYTQRDPLREAYIDSEYGDWSIRTGKQQVVWGTADGIKLLDTINPTDYSELNQNSPEDARITTWMINAEKDLEDGSNVQVIVSQPKENIFAGLNRGIDTSVRANNTTNLDDMTLNNGTDTEAPFMMKGPDTITGVYNGFLNIAPDLGSVATRFGSAFTPITANAALGAGGASELLITNLTTGAYTIGGAAPTTDAVLNGFNQAIGSGGVGNLAAQNMNAFTVGGFSELTMTQMDFNLGGGVAGINLSNIPPGFRKAILDTWQGLGGTAAAVSAAVGYRVTGVGDLTGATMLDAGFQPLYNTNLASFGDGKADSAFEYMTNTTFRTFDAFVNARSQYVYNMPKDSDVDVAARFKGSTQNGLNYSMNASYNYDKNPIVNLSWRGTAGQKLVNRTTYHNPQTGAGVAEGTAGATTTRQLYDPTNTTAVAAVAAAGLNTVDTATDGFYGGANAATGRFATLQFSQELERVKQLGGSFDTAIETKGLGPVVIRGEVLYTKGGRSPVMALSELSTGGLVEALTMRKADRFKYVLGVDITVLKNMLVSTQFIQDRNLDHIDDNTGYTADYATIHLSNGFKKAEKNKEFYSLFLSKPFGASNEHRWNNIFILEDNGGKWNRLDAEFSINDDTIATIEYNKYFGGEDTQFGQLKNSSNIQVGLKYTF